MCVVVVCKCNQAPLLIFLVGPVDEATTGVLHWGGTERHRVNL